MPTPQTEKVLEILQRHFKPREEGWAWLALHDDGDAGVVSEITGPYEGSEETARGLAGIIRGVGAHNAYLALCRSGGRPTEGDRELWRHLRAQVSPDVLVDMVVFNDTQAWSMRAEDAAAA